MGDQDKGTGEWIRGKDNLGDRTEENIDEEIKELVGLGRGEG